MDYILLNDIPCEFDREAIFERLHVKKDSQQAVRLDSLIAEAQGIAKPKALYRPVYVESIGDDFAIIDGVKFDGQMISENLKGVCRVFAYNVTCGREIDSWLKNITKTLESYWANMICQMAVGPANKALSADIEKRFKVTQFSKMMPGHSEAWPVTEQKKLFSLLGDTKGLTGVELTSSCLMVPIKSNSGIIYAKETIPEICSLCDRQDCGERKEL